MYTYIESVLIAVTVKKRISLYFGRTLFWVFSFVHKIVLFGAFPRAKNRALDRAFWCSPSCQKPCSRSCFLVLSFVPQTVLFGAFPRGKNRALDRAFWCSPSCQKSCSRSCSLLQLLGLCEHIHINTIYIYIPGVYQSLNIWFCFSHRI